MIENGDKYAELVLNAMIYQIAKQIGGMSVNFGRTIDGIILTGAIAKSDYFISILEKYISFLGKIIVMPGEKEMEALAFGTLRVLKDEEKAIHYTGIPISF